MKEPGRNQNEPPVDPYTGEPEPLAEDAGKVVEIVPLDPGDRKGRDYLLNEETTIDSVAADADADAAADLSARETEEADVAEDFKERQEFAMGGRGLLEEELEDYNAVSPELSGGDIDADWQDANVSGEESVGGTVPTPDQDVVDELGEAVGLTYKADEPLSSLDKIQKRDRKRWELNPKSAEDNEDIE